jgi:micrococcal nuclease
MIRPPEYTAAKFKGLLRTMNRILILASLLVVGSAYAKETYGDLTISHLIRVYDGDTFYVDVEGLHPIIGKEMSIRIRGVDTPEIRNNRNKNKLCDREHELEMRANS